MINWWELERKEITSFLTDFTDYLLKVHKGKRSQGTLEGVDYSLLVYKTVLTGNVLSTFTVELADTMMMVAQ
jgi:hypothetical protein